MQVSGQVEKFATIQPKYVRMRGLIGMVPATTVKIIPEPKHPFKIEEVRALRGNDIRFELKPLNDTTQNGYELVVENLKKTKGRYSDTIILKTDNKAKPEIEIRVYGDILDKPQEKQKPDLKPAPRSPLTQPKVIKTPKQESEKAKDAKAKDESGTAESKKPPPPKGEAQPTVTPSKETSDASASTTPQTNDRSMDSIPEAAPEPDAQATDGPSKQNTQSSDAQKNTEPTDQAPATE